jgi:hypothetical protein
VGARRLKRVFGIDVESWEQCGARMQIIAGIEEPALIGRILQHLQEKVEYVAARNARGPPQGALEGIE